MKVEVKANFGWLAAVYLIHAVISYWGFEEDGKGDIQKLFQSKML